MAISTLTSSAILYYEDTADSQKKQAAQALFPEIDISTAATVRLDQYTGSGGAARVTVTTDEGSHVRQYQPGSGFEYEVPITREKVAIDQTLSDSVIAGMAPNSPESARIAQLVGQIMDGPSGLRPAIQMAWNKAAIDVLRLGVMQYNDGTGIAVSIDYNRDATLAPVAAVDFDTATNRFDTAIEDAASALSAFGFPLSKFGVLLGASWLGRFGNESDVQEKRKYSVAPAYTGAGIYPAVYGGAEGLYIVDPSYKVNGLAMPVTIMTYQPRWAYRPAPEADPEPYIPDDEMIIFPIDGPGWSCYRGIQVASDGMEPRQMAGEIIISSYQDYDPDIQWLRAASRFMFVPGNKNHTYKIAGTNFGANL